MRALPLQFACHQCRNDLVPLFFIWYRLIDYPVRLGDEGIRFDGPLEGCPLFISDLNPGLIWTSWPEVLEYLLNRFQSIHTVPRLKSNDLRQRRAGTMLAKHDAASRACAAGRG
jgi:hypothetical protein